MRITGHVIGERGSLETFCLCDDPWKLLLVWLSFLVLYLGREEEILYIRSLLGFSNFRFLVLDGWMDGTVLGKEMDGNLMINNI